MNKYPLYHVGALGCGEIALYTEGELIPGDVLCGGNVILVNGERPLDYVTEIKCGHCDIPISPSELEYRKDYHGLPPN